MYVSYRHLIALSAACIAVVALALAYRISQNLPKAWVERLPGQKQAQMSPPLSPDSSFYDAAATPAPGGAKASGKNPIQVRQANASNGPIVSSEAYLVGNVATGKIYLTKNSSLVLPVASMSKLITAFAATETMKGTQLVTITDAEMNTATDTSHLSVGERFTVNELLYPMLLNSSNVAAEALASTTNRTKFLETMSSYAWEIGMPSTYFADPSGVDPHNISNAGDFFNLAKYLYKSRPDILKLTRTVDAVVATTSDHAAHDFISIHPFVTDPDFIGGKTGHTPEARDTMLTILNIGGQPIAFVVLASDNRKTDTDALIDAYKKANP